MMSDNPIRDILLYGAAGFAVQVLEALVSHSGPTPPIAGFIDALNPERRGEELSAYQVLGGEEVLEQYNPDTTGIVVAFGTHQPRIALLRRLRSQGWHFPRCIHALAVISPSAHVSDGAIIAAGAVIDPCCEIGFGAIVNEVAVVGHEAKLEQYVQVCPNSTIGARSSLAAGAFIGMGASILPDIHVGADACVGAGAVVCRNVPDSITVVGVPARPLGDVSKGN